MGSYEGSSPIFMIKYRISCEGKASRVFAYAEQSTDARYIDAGGVTFANGVAHAVTGAYQALPSYTIQVSNLPAGTTSVTGDILVRSGFEIIDLSPRPDNVTPQGDAAMLTITAAPGGNMLRIAATGAATTTTTGISAASTRIAPASIVGMTNFNASVMLPMFDSLIVDTPHPLSLKWVGGGSAGTLITVEAVDISGLEWRAYLDPSATALEFPALPADLGLAQPSQTFDAIVTKYDIPGATAAGITQTLQRVLSAPLDAALLPPEGSSDGLSMTGIGFDSVHVR